MEHSGSGPRHDRQEGPHAHSSIFTPDGRFLVVADLGIDRLVMYAFDSGEVEHHRSVTAVPGSGPRHMAWLGDRLLVVEELNNRLAVYRYDGDSLQPVGAAPTLPPDAPPSTAADVHVVGDRVFVSNRGHDSVAVLALDPAGAPGLVDVVPSGGSWPRGFAPTPVGRHLVVANRRSDELVVLPLHAGHPAVGAPVARLTVSAPASVAVALNSG